MSSSFDCFDVLEQSPSTEIQDQPNEILYTEKKFQNFKTLTVLGFDLPSNHSSDSEGSSNDSKTPKKSKKITKPKRSRKLTENSIWEKKD